jgi:phage repressor protein C with HTH and peptisase S24 domain
LFGYERLPAMAKSRLPSAFWPLKRARVTGNSMAPTFEDGDLLLVQMFSGAPKEIPLRTVVLIERELQPGILYIKRIQKSHSGAYWVEGDNRDPDITELMSDSRVWGYLQANEIRGRVLLRIGPPRKRKTRG